MHARILLSLCAITVLAAVVVLTIGHAPPDARAAEITVTTTDDELNADGDCSLREAISAANTDTAVDACPAGSGADVITLPADTYTLTIPPDASPDDNGDGDLDVADAAGDGLTINGEGAATTIIQACDSSGGPCVGIDRVFHVTDGDFAVADLTIRNGTVAASGAGIFDGTVSDSLTLTNVTVANNSSTASNDGGGLRHTGTGPLVITNSTVENNTADAFGGGVVTGGDATINNTVIRSNHAGSGGGALWNQADTLLIEDSVLTENTSDDIGGAIFNPSDLTIMNSEVSGNAAAGLGGGIANTGQASLINTTLSGNDAGEGGAIVNLSDPKAGVGTLTALNVTIADNTNDGDAAGLLNFLGASATMTNTIVANSPEPNCNGLITSGGHNLEDADSCGFTAGGDMTDTDPLLGPLADNGGPTQTHALLTGSPAIDTADDAACPDTDQRGVPRPQDGDLDDSAICDIGAYELQILPTPTSTAPAVPTDTPGVPSAEATATVAVTTLPVTGEGSSRAGFAVVGTLIALAAAGLVAGYGALRLRHR